MIYIENIKTAFIFFPFIAFIFTIPYIIYQMRKFGSLKVIRIGIVYSFILYLISAYFMVILPLPKITEVAKLTTRTHQFIPFDFISGFVKDIKEIAAQGLPLWSFFTRHVFLQTFFNLLLLLPLGIYLRYYFNCSFKKTLLIGFLVTLFFELTQLSGLYGIYPRPYRLFDVDDLMSNTLGCMIGYYITPLLARFLPTRSKLDQMSYKSGEYISLSRRFVAFFIDWFIVFLVLIIFSISYAGSKTMTFSCLDALVILFLYFILQPYFWGGQTIGKRVAKLSVKRSDGTKATMKDLILRYTILYVFMLPSPFISVVCLALGMELIDTIGFAVGLFILGFACMLLSGAVFINMVMCLFTKRDILFHDKLSKTENFSTIIIPKRYRIMNEEDLIARQLKKEIQLEKQQAKAPVQKTTVQDQECNNLKQQ